MKISGKIVDIHAREIYQGFIEIENGRIANLGREVNSSRHYLMPGFIDSHVHIESSMVVPSEFARVAVSHGTVAAVADPHEIANVMGIEGVEYMIGNGSSVPFKFMFGAPSCVPATPLESSGAVLGAAEVESLLQRKEIGFLSEMMNYPGVIAGDPEVAAKLGLARSLGKPVDGHAPGVTGEDLKRYIGAGISTDHEASTLGEAREKIAAGMKILIREGSAARNLEALAPVIGEARGMVMLCSDDIHPEMLVKRHINGVVTRLLEMGYNLFDVLEAAALNAVNHYSLDVGLLRVGDPADFIVVQSIDRMEVLETWIDGERVFGEGVTKFGMADAGVLNRFKSAPILPEQIEVENRGGRVRVIDVTDGELLTKTALLKWSNSRLLRPDIGADILKLVVKERYNDLPPVVGFIRGIGLKRGAIATTVAHDSHNIIAVGTDDRSIAGAIESIVRTEGGLVVYDNGASYTLALPVAGIMSNVPCGTVAGKYLELTGLVKGMGSPLEAPFMTLSFMSLLVIPELKLGDRGLFDGRSFSFVSLFEEEEQQ